MLVLLVLSTPCGIALARKPGQDVHYWHSGNMPPGAIGSRQLQRGGPLPGYFQPIEIRAPQGVRVAMASEGQFEPPTPAPVKVGALIGAVYRFKVTGIPGAAGLEVFPTVEVVNRLYPPHRQELRFPIPVELTAEDLRLALEGKFVTRVIYLEEPRNAVPTGEIDGAQSWFEAEPGSDPLAVADTLGRPMAILRLGGRVPDLQAGVDPRFFFGSPPLMRFVETAIRPREPSPEGAPAASAPPAQHRVRATPPAHRSTPRMARRPQHNRTTPGMVTPRGESAVRVDRSTPPQPAGPGMASPPRPTDTYPHQPPGAR